MIQRQAGFQSRQALQPPHKNNNTHTQLKTSPPALVAHHDSKDAGIGDARNVRLAVKALLG